MVAAAGKSARVRLKYDSVAANSLEPGYTGTRRVALGNGNSRSNASFEVNQYGSSGTKTRTYLKIA
jgi:hypothetical protein